jgi:DNA-binding NarL/FixJ family response regulator
MRVLLTNLPPLLRDVLNEALAAESDLAVLVAALGAVLLTVVRALSPGVVLTQASSNEAHDLARELGTVGLVAIDPESRHALVFARGPEAVLLSDVSPTTIIAAIRSMA